MTVSCACPAGDEAQGAGKENPRKSGSPLTRAPSIRPLTWSGHGLGLCPVARRLGAPRCPWATVDGFLDNRVPPSPPAAAGRLTLNT